MHIYNKEMERTREREKGKVRKRGGAGERGKREARKVRTIARGGDKKEKGRKKGTDKE